MTLNLWRHGPKPSARSSTQPFTFCVSYLLTDFSHLHSFSFLPIWNNTLFSSLPDHAHLLLIILLYTHTVAKAAFSEEYGLAITEGKIPILAWDKCCVVGPWRSCLICPSIWGTAFQFCAITWAPLPGSVVSCLILLFMLPCLEWSSYPSCPLPLPFKIGPKACGFSWASWVELTVLDLGPSCRINEMHFFCSRFHISLHLFAPRAECVFSSHFSRGTPVI